MTKFFLNFLRTIFSADDDRRLSAEKSHAFMLAEYSLIKDLRASSLSQIESRLNFYFSSVSGIVAALALLYQFTGSGVYILLVAVVLLAILLLLGLMTFNRIIQGHISVTRYTRGLNLIRGYFVHQYRFVGPYINNPISDIEPKFGNLGFISLGTAPKINKIGLTAMALLLNSFVLAMFVLVLLRFFMQPSLLVDVLTGFSSFTFSLLLHNRYINRLLRQAEISYQKDRDRLEKEFEELPNGRY